MRVTADNRPREFGRGSPFLSRDDGNWSCAHPSLEPRTARLQIYLPIADLPVNVFVMLISPQDQPGQHLRALENVSRNLRDTGFVRSLCAATGPSSASPRK